MITEKGKELIGKYLLGQAPAYGSFVAVGCGAKPLQTGNPYGDYSLKENLDFEMFRIPISSRGFVNDAGAEKLVLTAELPTEERYEITEIGIFSAGSNPSAGAFDSKTVLTFTQGEGWQYHTSTSTLPITQITVPLDNGDNIISTTEKVFQTNADNATFYKSPRPQRYERCRFLNNIILMRGDDANLTKSGGHFVINSGSNHIHLSGANVDFSKNSVKDELRMAFSLVSKTGNSSAVPDTVRILVDFAESDLPNTGEYARFEIELTNGNGTGGTYDFSSNRYFVITNRLEQLYQSANFSWNAVNLVKIYTSVIVGGSPSSNYYIALDALRLENTQTVNPLYGLTGYSVVKNATAETIVKSPNTSNYIEFRFSIGVT